MQENIIDKKILRLKCEYCGSTFSIYCLDKKCKNGDVP